MRFRKGSKVEVLTQNDVPSGSWRCAEIIGGNGHNYTVRYDGDVSSFGEEMVEKVPRKAIRPCPPSVDVVGDWVPGDVVEVFHNCSWKMATILMVSGWTHLLVRLLGSTIELKAHKYDVRARLCWQDGEWTMIGKVSNMYEDTRFRVPSSQRKADTIDSQRGKGHYQIGIHMGRNQKVRVGEEGSQHHRINVLRRRRLAKKNNSILKCWCKC